MILKVALSAYFCWTKLAIKVQSIPAITGSSTSIFLENAYSHAFVYKQRKQIQQYLWTSNKNDNAIKQEFTKRHAILHSESFAWEQHWSLLQSASINGKSLCYLKMHFLTVNRDKRFSGFCWYTRVALNRSVVTVVILGIFWF